MVEDPEDEILHLGIRQVEQPLVADQRRLAPLGAHHPLGMALGQLALRVDHLGLDPDAELQPQLPDLIHQLRQAAVDLLLIHIPVPKAGVVIIPGAKPTVIHDNHIDAERRRALRQLQ